MATSAPATLNGTSATTAAATLETNPQPTASSVSPTSDMSPPLDPKVAPASATSQSAPSAPMANGTTEPPNPSTSIIDDSHAQPPTDATPSHGTAATATAAAAATPSSAANPTPTASTASVPEEPELDFEGNVAVTNDIPTAEDLARIDPFLVLDSEGESRPFSALYRGEGVAPRQLIIFVRHFFCGNCQEYLRELSASITPEDLLTLPTPTFITVIGCGRPELIEDYVKTTGCPFPIYADPSRKLYDSLSMTRTWDLGPKPAYFQSNMLVTSLQSIVQGLKTGSRALKGGDFKQVGGEFLLEDGKCVWAHRMRNTRDHAEVSQLREVLGFAGEERKIRKRWSHSVKAVQAKQKRSGSWGKGTRTSKEEKAAAV